MRVHRFDSRNGGELYDRFLALRERIYRDDYFFYSDAALHRHMIDYYSRRPDYRLEMLLCEGQDGEDVARVLVGRARDHAWTFFGFFECPDDPKTFAVLMDAALESARPFGGDAIVGPIDFNSVHPWMFQLDAAPRERWVGDLYHRSYYPELFGRAGWRTVDEAVSGELSPEGQTMLLKRFGSASEELGTRGFDFVCRGDLPDDEFLRLIWELANENFTSELHRYVAIDYEFFRTLYCPLLARLGDPLSMAGFLKDGKLAAYSTSFVNYIEDLCNPDGRKARPAAPAREPSRFSGNVTAVAKAYRGTKLFPAMAVLGARHCEWRYGHRLNWRRTSVRNPGTAKLRAISTVTNRHVTFGRPLR